MTDKKSETEPRSAFFDLVPVDCANKPILGDLHLQSASRVVNQEWSTEATTRGKPDCILSTIWRENGIMKAQESLMGTSVECTMPWIRATFRRWYGDGERRFLYIIQCNIDMIGPIMSKSFITEQEARRKVKCSETLRGEIQKGPM